MTEVREVLERAAALVDSPEKWIKWAPCLDGNGSMTTIADPDACSFCLSGAIHRAAWEQHGHGDAMMAMAEQCEIAVATAPLLEDWIAATDESDILYTLTAPEDAQAMLFSVNDRPETTHDDVVAWLKSAIEAAP